ncbi:MAG: EAL domain-containing protein [Clostridia bacterium]|nr:EAL domain-containing protein [Clostridia bacterium]
MKRFQYEPYERALIEASPIPFVVYQYVDSRVALIAMSQGFVDLFDIGDRAETMRVMDTDMFRMNHPDDRARVADEALRFATQGGEFNVVYRVRLGSDPHYSVVHSVGRHTYAPDGTRLAHVWYTREGAYSEEAMQGVEALSGSFNQMLRENSMVYQNRFDPITGLPNMTYFFELAEAGIRSLRAGGRPAAILFMDLCGMKAFNNRWGYSGGDQLIRAFGQLLSETFTTEKCARFGQDHFAAFAEADGLDARLDAMLAKIRDLNGGNALPARVGVYLPGDAAVEIGKACDRAKMACDVDRTIVTSRYRYFDARMLEDVERRQYVIDHLEQALAEGWIKVYYQPIIRTANGRVCDEEALSRWIDPVKGFLSPAEFIPALEEAKLIYKVDLYVVDQALQKMKRQAEAGLYVVPESVNLSRTDFDCCDIVEEIRRRVDAAGIGREKLTIEITESVVGSNFDFIKGQVERFRGLGFKVWMDDFGSGYSSLDVLQSIHFDVIKIDMRFMQQFDRGEETRVILTELVKMAIGLGVETVCEGVEREDQVEFLREIGCTKIQGFYYCKPIPPEEIIERNRKGIQIGFENPAESDYYAAIGRANLYDMGIIASEADESLSRYFDTLPMAILEYDGRAARYVRCNKSYREFLGRTFGVVRLNEAMDCAAMSEGPGAAFFDAVMRCSHDGNRAMIEETVGGQSTVHSFIRRVAVNPVTGTAAVAVAVLAIIDQKDGAGTTYEHIARALSADYINLYYVDLDDDSFIEYSSRADRDGIAVERRGSDFFNASREDAKLFLYKEDQAAFINAFTKENILSALDGQGSFLWTYRLMMDGQPTYVTMKGMRMQADRRHIIIGVSNTDAQVRQKEALARMQAEQSSIARVTALSGNYIAIYVIDPDTDRYVEYSASTDYTGLGLAKQGEDFFTRARDESLRVLYKEDVDRFLALFTRERVMADIEQAGIYTLTYRLMLGGAPNYVSIRAVLVKEQDVTQLVIGVSNIDAQIRREQDYERKLSAARSRANLDGLTGVRNRSAYEDMSDALTRQIEQGEAVQYAIVLCRVTGLDAINAAEGRGAGDQRIRAACRRVCNTFKHSPVFRVAGDTFAVIAQGQDYEAVDALLASIPPEDGVACGMAKYIPGENVAAVFGQAEAGIGER